MERLLRDKKNDTAFYWTCSTFVSLRSFRSDVIGYRFKLV